MKLKAVSLRCPICRKPVSFGDPWMPFCSERCKLIDLGNWAEEKYVISAPLQEVPAEEECDQEQE